MLRLRSLEAGYGKLRVLKSISLHVNPGEIVTIIGANGAGKSTLLNTIAGLIRPMGGTIRYGERDVTGVRAETIVSYGCSLVPEGRQLFASMDVQENLQLGGYLTHSKDKNVLLANELERIYELFPILGDRRRQLAGTLSGGRAADAGDCSIVDVSA